MPSKEELLAEAARRGLVKKPDTGARLASDLQKEVGVSPIAAAGIVGNLAHESNNFNTLQEQQPLSGRGGYGYAQWTGPRRDAFEQWSASQGLDPASYEANKGFLVHELKNTPEGAVLGDLQNAQTPEEAAVVFQDKFLRPGIPHTESRVQYAQKYADQLPNNVVTSAQMAPSRDALIAEAKRRGLDVDEKSYATASPLQAGVMGAADTLTFGAFDEIMARLMGGDYEKNLEDVRGVYKQAQKERPVSFLTGGIVGGVAGGGAGASALKGAGLMSGATAIAKARPIATGIASGAAGGAAYGFGSGEGGMGDRLKEASVAGSIGGALGGIGGKIAKNVANPKAAIMSSDTIKEMSNEAYSKADELGGVLNPSFTNKFISDAKKLPRQTFAGRVIAGDDDLTNVVSRIETLQDTPLSLREAQEIDEALGDLVDKHVDAGRLTKQGNKLLDLQRQFRAGIEQATPDMITGGKEGFEALKTGRSLWSKQVQMRDIERIIEKAQTTDNVARSMRTGFANIANNPKRMSMYPKEVQFYIKKAAKGDTVENILRVFGSRLPATLLGGAGLATLNPLAVGAAVGSHAVAGASRAGAEAIRLGKARDVQRSIQKGIK